MAVNFSSVFIKDPEMSEKPRFVNLFWLEAEMKPDLWSLYSMMLKSRLFEEAVAKLWYDGLISGEMHMGTGEEAIIAGVISQIQEGDALALDHRGTAALLMRGVDPVAIVLELLGHSNGLCGGMGGHMHLFSKTHLIASSGIVGAAGPTAAGFALSAKYVRSKSMAAAFFGEGAMNQGMLMEAMNLASVWKLPVLFVCKDDNWSITSKSDQMTGGDLNDRAEAFGIPVLNVDGRDVSAVWEKAYEALESIRLGRGPVFLHASCVHLEAHFLGMQLLRIVKDPVREMPDIAVPLTRAFLKKGGAGLGKRIKGLKSVLDSVMMTLRDPRRNMENDPVARTRALLETDDRLETIEKDITAEIDEIIQSATREAAL